MIDNVPQFDVQYIFYLIYRFFTGAWWREILDFFVSHRALFLGLSVLISLLALTGIVYSILRIKEIREEEARQLRVSSADLFTPTRAEHDGEDARWIRILELVTSDDPGNWRLAVLEADVMLDELVKKINPHGDSLGERLRGIEQSDFATLNAAWEAHKVRNEIAHRGTDFVLTQREARRVIGLFEDVFREFHVI